jgi:transcriptional regulator with PAS, ATPase and Fis domain
MKEIAIFYRDRDNQPAIKYIANNFYRILGNNIHITNYYLNELCKGYKVTADAYLVCYAEMLGLLIDYVDDFSKVIVITRCIRKEYVLSVYDIPKGTDVLVVNDSHASIIQTIYMFYELGIGHLHFIPFEKNLAEKGAYSHIDTAIVTRYSEHMIPSHIKKICNIQNREVSFETMQKLICLLGLEHLSIQGNLIKKANEDMDTGINFANSYFSNLLKEQMMTSVIEESTRAILLVDINKRLHYINETAYDIFGLKIGDSFLSELYLTQRMITENEYKDEILTYRGGTYLVEKINYYLADEYIGYILVLQNEYELRETASNLSKQLKHTGFYAKYNFSDIVHKSVSMKKCIEMAKKVASSDYTVLVRGESGTGKELLVQGIHNYSERRNNAFVAINCATLPETLLESELFGYDAGTFTGAQKHGKIGLFERANHGTLFLDEIGDISPGLQSSLLRAIQEKQIMRIGSEKIIDVDVRIITATNANLEALVKNGTFRSDLFYRLNVITIEIEPLKKRREDILPLFESFLGMKYSRLTNHDKATLLNYLWPGNVRELENIASHYKLFNQLPDNIASSSLYNTITSAEIHTPFPSHKHIETEILRIISLNTSTSSGIGRKKIMKKLDSCGLLIGEGVLKRILHEFNTKGLIRSSSGRGGSFITPLGESYLKYELENKSG